VRICERNNSSDTKVTEEAGGGGAPGTEAEVPLQPVLKTVVRQAVPLQPMEVHGGADIHMQPREDPTPQHMDVPEGGCDPVESPHWSRVLAGPVAQWKEEPTLEQICWQDWSNLFLKDCTPWKGPMLEQCMKNCSLWEGLMLERFMEYCPP